MMPPQLVERHGVAFLRRQGGDELAVAVHQEHRRGMVDAIAAARLCELSPRIDAELLLDLLDLRRAAGQADDRRIEQLRVAADFGRPIALRIDADEDDRQGVVALAELPAQLDQPRQGGRADVGAMGEAEEDRGRLAVELGAGERLAVAPRQRERPADGAQGSFAGGPACGAAARSGCSPIAASPTTTHKAMRSREIVIDLRASRPRP